LNYSSENNRKRKQKQKIKAKRVTNKIGIYVFRTFIALILVGCFALSGTLVGAYMGILENAPKLGDVSDISLDYTTVIYDKYGNEMDRLDSGENREYATSDKIPQHVKDAFVSIEDERFYTHDGVDYQGFVRAIFENIKSIGDEDATTQGASTITQQLIKNKLQLKRNTIITKLQEQYLAIEYEKQLTETYDGDKMKAKDYILELYLNIITLGDGQYGVQAAALHYFGKDISEVTLEEACVIAAITQNPSHNNPFRDPVKNSKRAQTALDKMLELGFITQAEFDKADLNKAYETVKNAKQTNEESPSYHNYYVDQVISDAITMLSKEKNMSRTEASNYLYRAGLHIYTNYDPAIQAIVDEAYMSDQWFPANEFEVEVSYTLSTRNVLTDKVTHHPKEVRNVPTFDDVDACIESFKDKLLGPDDVIEGELVYAVPQPQGAIVIMDQYTGKVVALAGGRGEKLTGRGFNRATAAERHPGSVFKVLASYVPALDMGLITPGTVLDDVPYIYPDYANYEASNWYYTPAYRGLNTVRNGIRNSMNVITVKNMYDTGVEACFNYLLNFGFTTLEARDVTLSTALGGVTYGVTQLETAAAYAAIANGGTYIQPTLISKILDHGTNLLLEVVPETHQVIRKTTAYLATDMMKDVITSGTGGRAAFKNIRMPIAGKTGTSSDSKDLTFAGYTPYYTAAVWLGFDTPKYMRNIEPYSNMHLQIWSHIMEQIHQDLPYIDFERPAGITTAKICTVSGQLFVEGLCDHDPRGSTARTEIFAVGTTPTEPCSLHQKYTICVDSGKMPGAHCPANHVETRVGFVRPVAYEGDKVIQDQPYEIPKALLGSEICDIHMPIIDPHVTIPGDSANPTPTPTPHPTEQPQSTPHPSDGANATDPPMSLEDFLNMPRR